MTSSSCPGWAGWRWSPGMTPPDGGEPMNDERIIDILFVLFVGAIAMLLVATVKQAFP